MLVVQSNKAPDLRRVLSRFVSHPHEGEILTKENPLGSFREDPTGKQKEIHRSPLSLRTKPHCCIHLNTRLAINIFLLHAHLKIDQSVHVKSGESQKVGTLKSNLRAALKLVNLRTHRRLYHLFKTPYNNCHSYKR